MRLDDLAGDTCEGCGAPLADYRRSDKRYCSVKCYNASYFRQFKAEVRRAKLEARAVRNCLHCGEPIAIEKDPRAKCCSIHCTNQYRYAQRRARRTEQFRCEPV